MRPAHLLFLVWLAGVVVAVSSCGDRTATGPSLQASVSTVAKGPASQDAVPNVATGTGLLRCVEANDASASAVLGPAGGHIDVGPATLVIPRGSLKDTVTITMEVIGDTVRAVRFLPQGLVFQRPAYLVMSYANCQTFGDKSPKRIAYTSDAWTILEYEQSWDDGLFKKVTGELNHFSNYAVAW